MKTELVLIIIVLIVVALLAGYHYVFHIYEIDYRLSSRTLYADYNSIVTIEAIAINSLGFRAPFRNPKVTFEISEGKELIEIVENDPETGILKVRAKGERGLVVIKVKSVYSIFPSSFEIEILPNIT
jgi:hypothetical protein